MHHNYANEPLVRERYSEVRPTDDSSFRIRYRIRSLHFVCFFLLLFILFFFCVSSFLSFRLWPASRSTEIISQYLGKKKLHRIMYYKIVLLQRVGKKKRTDRPEPIKTANRKEKNFCSPIKEVWNCFFFFMLFFGV